MSMRIKRSSDSTAPSSLDPGQLAYVEGTGKLYIGTIAGAVVEVSTGGSGGTAIHVGTTEPPSPSVGDLWVDTN